MLHHLVEWIFGTWVSLIALWVLLAICGWVLRRAYRRHARAAWRNLARPPVVFHDPRDTLRAFRNIHRP